MSTADSQPNAPESFRFIWQLSNEAHKHCTRHLVGVVPVPSAAEPSVASNLSFGVCLTLSLVLCPAMSFTSGRFSFQHRNAPADISWGIIRLRQCVHMDSSGRMESGYAGFPRGPSIAPRTDRQKMVIAIQDLYLVKPFKPSWPLGRREGYLGTFNPKLGSPKKS